MKTLFLEHIRKGRASDAASLVEAALRQKIAAVLVTERKAVASKTYGGPTELSEAAPGGNRPGTNPALKPKHTGLQSPEGQKLRTPEQSRHQQAVSLQKQVVVQREKAATAREQSRQSDEPKPASLSDAKIAIAKMQAANTKLKLLREK
jgi:hypothetical protein